MSDPAIPAATLVVVRERSSGPPELLMVERAEEMAFAGGALVFPGGRIDAADERFAALLGLGDDGSARVAAIRETLEETAVPAALAPVPSAEQALALQAALIAGRDFAELLAEHGLTIAAGALTAWDVQRAKSDYLAYAGTEHADKLAVWSALSLYLNLVNIFQLMLTFFGQREE